jgi:hypothetical protein
MPLIKTKMLKNCAKDEVSSENVKNLTEILPSLQAPNAHQTLPNDMRFFLQGADNDKKGVMKKVFFHVSLMSRQGPRATPPGVQIDPSSERRPTPSLWQTNCHIMALN